MMNSSINVGCSTGSITTTTTPSISTSYTWITGQTITTTPYSYNWTLPSEIHELSNLNYDVEFSYDKNDHLLNNILSIKNKYIEFNCDLIEKNRIQPYELIMDMIKNKIKFNMVIEVSDILTLKYSGIIFKKIKNNLTFDSGSCSFNKLDVKFKYDSIAYENNKLYLTEKRKDKLNNLKNKNII